MGDKEQALVEFLKSFRASLNNARMYFRGHPLLRKSLDETHERITNLFRFVTSLRIGVAPHALYIFGKQWEKEQLYDDLSQIFHRRKIRAIEIKRGVTADELLFLAVNVTLSPQDIIKEGGLATILSKANIKRVSAESLDYSDLLRSEGDEQKDVWGYLLNAAVDRESARDIHECVENFGNIARKFRAGDFVANTELRESVGKFLSYLKEQNIEQFRQCSKQLIETILRDPSVAGDAAVEQLQSFFSDASEDDLADNLWKEMTSQDDFIL